MTIPNWILTGAHARPLLRLGEVPFNLKPNHTKAIVYFGDKGEQYLPTAFAMESHRRTKDQMFLYLGQTQFYQGSIPKPLDERN